MFLQDESLITFVQVYHMKSQLIQVVWAVQAQTLMSI